MDSSNTYIYKELSPDNTYIKVDSPKLASFDVSTVNLLFILPYFESEHFIKAFMKDYQSFTISTKSKVLIDKLLENHNLAHLNHEFYLLSAIFQKVYIHYYEDPANYSIPGFKEYEDESKDLINLLDILYVKLTSRGVNSMKSISFKSRNTQTFNNHFIVTTILDALIDYYDITVENFEHRKKELLNDTVGVKLGKLDEFQKWELAKSLYYYISRDNDDNMMHNEFIRFVGAFLQISQIPVKKKDFEILSTTDLDMVFSQSDVNYLNDFIKEGRSFYTYREREI